MRHQIQFVAKFTKGNLFKNLTIELAQFYCCLPKPAVVVDLNEKTPGLPEVSIVAKAGIEPATFGL